MSLLPPPRYDLPQRLPATLLPLLVIATLSVGSWALLVWMASCVSEVVS